jgi:hypothetical protein
VRRDAKHTLSQPRLVDAGQRNVAAAQRVSWLSDRIAQRK